MTTDIKKLEEFIKPTLKKGQKFVSYKCNYILPPGENYGSVVLQVDITVLNENNQEEIIHCVAKMTPPVGFAWEAFNIKLIFKKEIAVYTTIVPALNEFGKEKGIECLMNFFAKALCARISLDPKSDVVDADGVLLLEDLKVQGYDLVDRFDGFDLEATKFLLRDMAIMHAATIAYKSSNPEEFEKKIRPYLNRGFTFPFNDDMVKGMSKQMQDAVASNPKCVPYLSKIEEAVLNARYALENSPKGNEIFTTLAHNDYWVNNAMLKYEDGKVVGSKIVDFQVVDYSSVANDVLYFLYSSASLSVLENSVDELIKFYYEEFIETLRRLQHDVSVYSFQSMMEEFALIAKQAQFTRILFILVPIMTIKGKAEDMMKLTEKDAVVGEISLHENYYKKMEFVLLDFVKKGWI